MGFIISVVLLLMAFGCYIKEKNLTSPEVMFNLVFAVVCFFSMFIYENEQLKICLYINYEIYLMVLLGCCSFTLGCGLCSSENKTQYVGLIISCYASIKLILQGGLFIDIYRLSSNSLYLENEFTLPKSLNRYLVFVAKPLYFVMIPVFICRFYLEQKIKYLFLVLTFVLLKTFSHLGRIDLIYCLLYFFILYINHFGKKLEFIENTKLIKKISRKAKFIFFLFLILIICCLVVILLVRNTNIVKTPINYFGTPLLYMQFMIEKVYKLGHTYGILSCLGFWQVIMIPFKIIGFETPECFAFAQHYQNLISEGCYLPLANRLYNAFTTVFYYFYVDYNWFGIIFLSLIFGFYSKFIFYKFINGLSIKWASYYLLTSLLIIFSFVRWQLSLSEIFLAFVYLFFLYRKDSNLKKINRI